MRAPPGRVGSRAGLCVRGATMCARVVDMSRWMVVPHLCPSPAAFVCRLSAGRHGTSWRAKCVV